MMSSDSNKNKSKLPRKSGPTTPSAIVPLASPNWLEQLDSFLRSRQVGKGFELLDGSEKLWCTLESKHRSSSDLLLTLAQWVDVGYRDVSFLRRMLDLLSPNARLQLSVGDYVRVRMAEAFYLLAVDDSDGTIRTLDVLLRLERELLDMELKTLAHLWKARAHRKNADYQEASDHIHAALELSSHLPDSQTIQAVLQIQQGWLIFQRGDVNEALKTFDRDESVLQETDHWIALGNIESARGRIIRRNGDYLQSMDHFLRAVTFYEIRHPHHPNLARAVTNLAFVKRLLALQLKRHIESSLAHRNAGYGIRKSHKTNLRPLHKQYQELYHSAIAELRRAKDICILHGHHSGLASAVLNAGYLHLDVGDLDLAEKEAAQAYAIGKTTNGAVLMARAKILSGLIENARLEELLGHPEDTPALARRAKQHCVDAVALAEKTENKRLMVNAHLALGEVAANGFFRDYALARRCIDIASGLIDTQEADYVVDELNALKGKLLRTVGIDDTLRAWSEGIVWGKTLQQVMEEFAELVVTKIWLREGRRTSRVAGLLATSPKKVRRLVRHANAPNTSRS